MRETTTHEPSPIAGSDAKPSRQLGLWDTVSVIIGIVVGVGIFETPRLVFQNTSSPGAALGLWVLGGVLSLIGALTYAELASTYPRSGGDYVYLTMAYGRPIGFLFAWAQLTVIMTGSIGMMAFVFANYATSIVALSPGWLPMIAVLPVVVLTAVNMLDVVAGKTTQNVLTVVKVLGVGGIILAGLMAASAGSAAGANVTPAAPAQSNFRLAALAMVPILLTYGGWNDAAFFAAEIRERRRIWQALVLSTVLITVLYLLLNAAYLSALGFEGARTSPALAAATLERAVGSVASKSIAVLVCISALGAMQGLIFAGSRIYATLGRDYRSFAWLARSSERHVPVVSLAMQALMAVGLIVGLGTPIGQRGFSAVLRALHLRGAAVSSDGFETLLRSTAPIFWLFFLLTSISVFVLRFRDPTAARPFSVPGYPITPLVFCATCAGMLYSAILYSGDLALVGAMLLAIGLPLYFFSRPVAKLDPLSSQLP